VIAGDVMKGKKALVVDADVTSRNFITRTLLQQGFSVLNTGSGKEGLIIAWRDRPDVIIIDPVLPDIKGEEMAFKLRHDARVEGIPLIALSGDQTPARLKSCLEAGFNEYIVKGGGAIPDLLKAVNLLFAPAPAVTAAKGNGLLIIFLSAKGGVGTSSLCANFANSIAISQPEARLAVVDLVLPIGSIASVVGYSGGHNLVTVADLNREETGAEFFLRELAEIPLWQFRLLAGSPDPESSNRLNVGRIGEIIESLKVAFDFVLVDIGRSLSRFTLSLIQQADLIVLVVSTDISTITLTKTLLDYLRAKGISKNSIYAVLNRAVGLEGLSRTEAEKILGVSIKTALPYLGSNFTLANNLHQPVLLKFPNDTASLILKEGARQMIDLAQKNALEPRRSHDAGI
jgi:pilus assembly protein CpaE